MSARGELHESMCGSCCGRYAKGECESVDRLIDAVLDEHAHRLAEKIRLTENEHPAADPWYRGLLYGANLIDPS